MKPTFPQRMDLRAWCERVKARGALRRLWRNGRVRRDLRRDYGTTPYCRCGQVHRGNGRAVKAAWRRVFVWSDEAREAFYGDLRKLDEASEAARPFTEPGADGVIDCIHCGSCVEMPRIHMYDGEQVTCSDCGGVNAAQVDEDGALWFPLCEDITCAACARASTKAPECVPGIRCTKTSGCTMAMHHIPPCFMGGEPCKTCGRQPWELCDRSADQSIAEPIVVGAEES